MGTYFILAAHACATKGQVMYECRWIVAAVVIVNVIVVVAYNKGEAKVVKAKGPIHKGDNTESVMESEFESGESHKCMNVACN